MGLFIAFRDAKCGKIQCQGGANRPVIGTNAVSIETNIPLQEGGKILCRGTHVYLGDDMPDPGLVLSGTKCEDGKVRFWNTPKQGEHHYPHAAKYFVLNCLFSALGFFFFHKRIISHAHSESDFYSLLLATVLDYRFADAMQVAQVYNRFFEDSPTYLSM